MTPFIILSPWDMELFIDEAFVKLIKAQKSPKLPGRASQNHRCTINIR
jgi:hypothetical protein